MRELLTYQHFNVNC